jgi:hypothetical protein
MKKKFLYPAIKFRSIETHLDKSQRIPAVIVKMQDFLCANGKPKMSALQKVERAGSLHEYLGVSGRIIISPIIPDPLLLRINCDTYSYLFEALQPDEFITPDGITYSGLIKRSRDQIDHILGITELLINRFPECTPIGLVKGCNLSQMDFHVDKLLELGITRVCLHAGDFLYKDSSYSKDQIIDFARYVREKVPFLMIYGVGSKHYFQRFYFADCYVTNSHFIQAFNHMVIRGVKWVNFKGKPTREIVMHNFEYLRNLVEQQSDVRELTEWMPVNVPENFNDPIIENASLDARITKIMEGQ